MKAKVMLNSWNEYVFWFKVGHSLYASMVQTFATTQLLSWSFHCELVCLQTACKCKANIDLYSNSVNNIKILKHVKFIILTVFYIIKAVTLIEKTNNCTLCSVLLFYWKSNHSKNCTIWLFSGLMIMMINRNCWKMVSITYVQIGK